MEDSLIKGIRDLLASGRAMSAAEIGQELGVVRPEVNSVLYRLKGEQFRKIDGSPPKWSLLDGTVVEPKPFADRHLARQIGSDLHIDFPGGDWVVSILLLNGSRNDPIVEVAKTGPRGRMISVSRHVFSAEMQDVDSKSSIDSIVAIAASALVWEIATSFGPSLPNDFDWGLSLSSVYLSLAAGLRLKSPNGTE